jgi:hypothetical protein
MRGNHILGGNWNMGEATELVEELDVVEMSSWCADELAGVDLGDRRLNARLVDVTTKLAMQPQAPINQACKDWTDTKASYRLFQNEKMRLEDILAPHQRRTMERMRGYPLVLAVEDTCYLDYNSHVKTVGLGPIGTQKQDLWGLVLHSTLAVTPAGLPLGVLTAEVWAREAETEPMSDWERRKRPIEEKESYKWLKALQETVVLSPEGVQVVSVCDREGDVYELFVEAERLKADLLVRASQDRALAKAELGKLWAQTEAASVAGHLKVEVPARDGKPGREAIVSVRFCRVTLKPPWRSDREPLPEIILDAVLVREDHPPDDVTPLEWLLLTNVPVQCFEDAVERVKWYRCRWHIEVYFKVLKSGCKVEACRLGTAERLKRFIILNSIIAWRLYWITHINRHAPHTPCSIILTEHEWHALYATIHRTSQPPPQTPTTHEAVRWVARLGGFLDRKGDGQPGVTAIWRGWQRLQDISATWLLLHGDSYG